MNVIEVESLADTHFHLRQREDIMSALIRYALEGGTDVLGIMPNLKMPIVNARSVTTYRDVAARLVPLGRAMRFIPFVMITEDTTEEDIDECVSAGIVDGKVYPYLRTTMSEHGVKHYGKILHIIKYCGTVGMKCHFHPEHPSPIFTNRDAEFCFLPLMRLFLEESEAIIVWEHGTDARCIPHWEDMATSGRFFVTLTAHHLATNEDKTFGDVLATCKPPIKTESDRQALIHLVGRDYPWVMAGTDCAWHPRERKHVLSGQCACGDFIPFALSLYAHALEGLLFTPAGVQIFVNFTSRNARRLHKLPASSKPIRLANEPCKIFFSYPVGLEEGLPFWAGQMLNWKIIE
ncbi:MAG: hypothetical protein WCV79_00240 [Candidatus Paceibacterota bacterium]